MSIAINKVMELYQYEMKVDFGMGGIPLGDFILAIVVIIAVMAGYWWYKSHKD